MNKNFKILLGMAVGIAIFMGATFVAAVVYGVRHYVRRAQTERAIASLQAHVQDLGRRTAEELRGGVEDPAHQAEVDRVLEEMREIARGANDPRAQYYVCLADSLAPTVRLGKELRKTQASVEGILDLHGLTGPDVLSQRMARLDTYGSINQQVIESMERLPVLVNACLARPFKSSEVRPGLPKTAPSHQAMLEVRRLDQEFAVVAGRVLRLLESSYGHYQYDIDRNVITFDRDADLREYDAGMQAVEDIAKRSEEATTRAITAFESEYGNHKLGSVPHKH